MPLDPCNASYKAGSTHVHVHVHADIDVLTHMFMSMLTAVCSCSWYTQALDRAMQPSEADGTHPRTVLVIAHRLSTVRNAHTIVALDKGKVGGVLVLMGGRGGPTCMFLSGRDCGRAHMRSSVRRMEVARSTGGTGGAGVTSM
jgi:hypothetical protein